MIFLSSCWLSWCSHRVIDLNGEWGSLKILWPSHLLLSMTVPGIVPLFLFYLSMTWEAPWQRGFDYFVHCWAPSAPVGPHFTLLSKWRTKDLGWEKDLPKIVRPAIGKIWSRSFIFWLQIVWLFCNKNKIDFYLRFFIIWGALICIEDQNHTQFTFIGW